VLLAGEGGYTVPEIREMTNTYDKTIRKWIHRFNDNGSTNGLFTEINYSPPMIKITDRAKKEIINAYHHQLIQENLVLKFSAWSLRSIAGYVREKKIVVKEEEDGISHTTIRDTLSERT
jgi:transposase